MNLRVFYLTRRGLSDGYDIHAYISQPMYRYKVSTHSIFLPWRNHPSLCS